MREIYTLRDYLQHPNLRILLCTVELTEFSVQTAPRKRQKLDRVPNALREIRILSGSADYAELLPESLTEPFTVQMLSAAIHAPDMQTRMLLNLLVRFGIIEEAGKSGRTKLWKRCDSGVIRG